MAAAPMLLAASIAAACGGDRAAPGSTAPDPPTGATTSVTPTAPSTTGAPTTRPPTTPAPTTRPPTSDQATTTPPTSAPITLPETTPPSTIGTGLTGTGPTGAPLDPWGQPVPPANAPELAQRLVAAEARLTDGQPITAAEVVAIGHEHQIIHRTMARNPGWGPELAGLLDAPTAARLAAVTAAGDAGDEALPEPLAVVPAWRIRPPLGPDELTALYHEAEAATGTPWSVLAAINFVETRMGRIVGLSSAGAQGPMQFIPSTWAIYGARGDPYDDGDAIHAAGRLLAASGAPQDLRSAVFAYNHSTAYVDSVLGYAAAIDADPWLSRALWGWQVYIVTTAGLQWLPEGFETPVPTPLADLPPLLPPAVPSSSEQ